MLRSLACSHVQEIALVRADFSKEAISKEEASRLLADILFCYYDTDTFKVCLAF